MTSLFIWWFIMNESSWPTILMNLFDLQTNPDLKSSSLFWPIKIEKILTSDWSILTQTIQLLFDYCSNLNSDLIPRFRSWCEIRKIQHNPIVTFWWRHSMSYSWWRHYVVIKKLDHHFWTHVFIPSSIFCKIMKYFSYLNLLSEEIWFTRTNHVPKMTDGEG